MNQQLNKKTINKLYSLLYLCKKDFEIYGAITDITSDYTSKNYFNELYNLKALFHAELFEEIISNGNTPKYNYIKNNKITHNKLSFTSNKNVLLKEYLKNENYTIKMYEEILKNDIPPRLFDRLMKQLKAIKTFREKVSLKKSTDYHLNLKVMKTSKKIIAGFTNAAIAIALSFGVVSCSTQAREQQVTVEEKETTRETEVFVEEMNDLSAEINSSIANLESEISQMRTDLSENPENTDLEIKIAEKESVAETLRQKANEIGTVTEEGWDDFKKGVAEILDNIEKNSKKDNKEM